LYDVQPVPELLQKLLMPTACESLQYDVGCRFLRGQLVVAVKVHLKWLVYLCTHEHLLREKVTTVENKHWEKTSRRNAEMNLQRNGR